MKINQDKKTSRLNEIGYSITELTLEELASIHYATQMCPVTLPHSCTKVSEELSKFFVGATLNDEETEGQAQEKT